MTDPVVTITHAAAGGGYDSAAVPAVKATITENDTAGVGLSATSLTVDEGDSNTYTVVLQTQPSQDVTDTIVDPTDNTDVTTSPTSPTFTKDNWNTAQTVTVEGRPGHGLHGRHSHRHPHRRLNRHHVQHPHGERRGRDRNRR